MPTRRPDVVSLSLTPRAKPTRHPGWAAVAEIAAAQRAQLTLEQFEACGISEATVRRALDDRLFRTFPGVYSVGHPALDRDALRMAAVLACGEGALLGFQTGASVLGTRIPDRGDIDVVVPRSRRVRIAGIHAHQTVILQDQDRYEVRGLPVLAPARLLLDLGDLVAQRRLLARELERAIHELQVRHGLTLAQVNDVLDRAHGRRGAPRLAAACVGGIVVLRSDLEDAYRRFLRRHALPMPLFNHVASHDGIPWEFDAFFPRDDVAVELDSERFHTSGWAARRDRHKGNAAALIGATLLRYAWHDLVGDDRRALAEHRAALRLP